MKSTSSLIKRIATTVCACAFLAVGAIAMSGCSVLGVVDNEEPPTVGDCVFNDGDTITNGVLTVGVNGSNTPYAGTNSDGELVGYDVDIAAVLADECGCKVEIVDVGGDGTSAVLEGRVDVALGLTKPAEDIEGITYTSAYVNDGASLYCLSSNKPASISEVDFANSVFVVQNGTAVYNTLATTVPAENIALTDTMQEAFDTLSSGQATYLACDALVGDYYAKNTEGVERISYLSATDVVPIYMATSSAKSTLSTTIISTLGQITTSGELEIVTAKWLGSDGANLMPGKVDLDALPTTFPPTAEQPATDAAATDAAATEETATEGEQAAQ